MLMSKFIPLLVEWLMTDGFSLMMETLYGKLMNHLGSRRTGMLESQLSSPPARCGGSPSQPLLSSAVRKPTIEGYAPLAPKVDLFVSIPLKYPSACTTRRFHPHPCPLDLHRLSG